MTKTISLLGSTGSIGRQTLDVAQQLGLSVAALTARGGNLDLLEQQTRQFRPRLAAVYDPEAAQAFAQRVRDLPVKVVSGPEGLLEAAVIDGADTVVTAVVGMVGLRPTLAAIELYESRNPGVKIVGEYGAFDSFYQKNLLTAHFPGRDQE